MTFEPVNDAGGFEKQEREVGIIRRIMPRGLFGRSLLILITPVLLIQIITTLFFIDRHWSKVTSRLSHAVAGEIAVIAYALEEDEDRARLSRIMHYTNRHLSLNIQYHENHSLQALKRIKPSAPLEGLFVKTLHNELEKELQRPFLLRVDFDQKTVEVDVQLQDGVLEIRLPERRLFSSSGYVFLLWVFGSSILLLTIAVIFMRNQIRPIRKLAAAAKRLGRGRDVPSFKPEGAREIRDASQAFMDMHRRIKRQVSQRTAMLAGVSHDLRTPLTRLKLQLAMLGDSQDIKDMKNDISEMEKMIDGYLDFVRGEGGEQSVMTDINAVFVRVFKFLDHKNVVIHPTIDNDLHATLRPKAFERALINILQNAAKYADEIWVKSYIDADRKLVIHVDDNGPGIPEEQLEDVFKPFYQLDTARGSDGVGLGLSIAMDVIHGHGGKIWLEKSEHGGLAVRMRMPV